MKLKMMFLFLAISTTAWAEAPSRLLCSGQIAQFFDISLDMGAIGHVVYNYSSATVSCTGLFSRIATTKGIARCYGSWMLSLNHKGDLLEDVPAWVEVENNGQKITAKMRTAPYYGSKIIHLNCQLSQQNTALEE